MQFVADLDPNPELIVHHPPCHLLHGQYNGQLCRIMKTGKMTTCKVGIFDDMVHVVAVVCMYVIISV